MFFLCPLVLLLFRILLLHVSGILLSFYIVCIFFLPLLSSIPLLWSRFHIWILLIFFCPSTSSSLLSILVTLLWRFFCNVCHIWNPLSFSPLFCFSLSSFFYNLVRCHSFLLFSSICVSPFLTSSSPLFLFLALFPSWPFPQFLSLSFMHSFTSAFFDSMAFPSYLTALNALLWSLLACILLSIITFFILYYFMDLCMIHFVVIE